MFKTALCDDCDCCVVHNVDADMLLPTGLDDYPIVIISGSRHNCREADSLPWFHPLCEFIRRAAELGSPRVYGGCFGCQIVAFALGGEVGYNPDNKFVLKAENIVFNTEECSRIWSAEILLENDGTKAKSCVNCSCNVRDSSAAEKNDLLKNADSLEANSEIKTSENSFTLSLLESHGDCVLSLPENSVLLAQSASCANEVFVTGAHRNILACQGHPEFELQYSIRDRIWPAASHRLAPDEVVLYQQSLDAYTDTGARKMNQLIASFLKVQCG
jgi:GMP synthase-like glutamine amidotransferase